MQWLSLTLSFRPSEKLGTHSMSFVSFIICDTESNCGEKESTCWSGEKLGHGSSGHQRPPVRNIIDTWRWKKPCEIQFNFSPSADAASSSLFLSLSISTAPFGENKFPFDRFCSKSHLELYNFFVCPCVFVSASCFFNLEKVILYPLTHVKYTCSWIEWFIPKMKKNQRKDKWRNCKCRH